jgi:hypothetical protein
MMGGVSPETCWASYKYGIIKFWYIVASCWIFYYKFYYDARIHEHKIWHGGDLCFSFDVSVGTAASILIMEAMDSSKTPLWYFYTLHAFAVTNLNRPKQCLFRGICCIYRHERHEPWRRRQHIPLKARYISTTLYGLIYHTTIPPFIKRW